MAKIDWIFFDFDGTLVYLGGTKEEMEEVRNKLNMLFMRYGINEYFRPVLEKISFSLNILMLKGLSRGKIKSISEEAYGYIDEFEQKAVENSSIRKNAIGVLKLLNKNYKIGIVTNNGKKCINKALTFHNFPENMFSVIVTRDDTPKPKPHFLPLKLAIEAEKNYEKIRHIVYVGNNINDFKCGKELEKNTGIKVITVCIESKSFSKEILPENNDIDYFIKELSEIFEIIQKIENNNF